MYKYTKKPLEELRWRGKEGDCLPVTSSEGKWNFQLRTRPLSPKERKGVQTVHALKKIAHKLRIIRHWMVEIKNDYTGESFLLELSKITGDNENDDKNKYESGEIEEGGFDDKNKDESDEIEDHEEEEETKDDEDSELDESGDEDGKAEVEENEYLEDGKEECEENEYYEDGKGEAAENEYVIEGNNKVAVHILVDGSHRYRDRWWEYGFKPSKFIHGRVSTKRFKDPNDIYKVALEIMRRQPKYYLLTADCIAFATSLMQRISAPEDVKNVRPLRRLLGLDPHKDMSQAAKFILRTSTLICPKVYASLTVPRSHEKQDLTRELFAEKVRRHARPLVGYYPAKGLALGAKYAGEAVYQVGHGGKTAVAAVRELMHAHSSSENVASICHN